jgi:hypothetical protein
VPELQIVLFSSASTNSRFELVPQNSVNRTLSTIPFSMQKNVVSFAYMFSDCCAG